MLSKKEIKRYNRHLILSEIGLKGQEKLKNAKVLVVGAGGLGCPVLQYLTAAGVGTIGICDFDFIDESNLQRQILFGTVDIGKPKAKVAADKLFSLNPYINFNVHQTILTKENALEIFQNYDIIVDGTDNFPTRFLINDACVISNKPFVYGAIYKFEGQVAVFNYNNGPSYRCLIPEQPGSTEMLSCSQIGVMGVLPGIIGTYQANETIKIITGIGKPLSGQILLIDTLKLEHNLISIMRNEQTANINKLGDYGDFCQNIYPEIKQITSKNLMKRIENKSVFVIDIRDKKLFEKYRLKSTLLSIEELLKNPVQIPDNVDVVIVCEKGVTSSAVIEELETNFNLKNLYNLKGGIQEWIENDLPLITSE